MGATDYREDSTQERIPQASSDPGGGSTTSTDVLDYAARLAANAEQQCRGVVGKVTQYTRTQPWPALAMAAGLGLLIGRRLTAPRAGRRAVMSHASGQWPPRMESTS